METKKTSDGTLFKMLIAFMVLMFIRSHNMKKNKQTAQRMEYSESKEKKWNLNNPQKFHQEVNQSWITNNFFELTESSSIVIISILFIILSVLN